MLSQNKLNRNFIVGLKKFNKMYERISNNPQIRKIECQTIINYGKNLIKLYGEDGNHFDETKSKIRALENSLQFRV